MNKPPPRTCSSRPAAAISVQVGQYHDPSRSQLAGPSCRLGMPGTLRGLEPVASL